AQGQTVFTANITESVFQNNQGGLTYEYQITNTSGADTINKVSVGGFSLANAGAVSVGYLTSGSLSGMPAGTITPTTAEINSAGTIDFDFNTGSGNGLPAGATTKIFYVVTQNPTFTTNTLQVQDNGNASVIAFAPTPEPSSLLLLG